jgi:arginine/lysine/ornithine decarboxylase
MPGHKRNPGFLPPALTSFDITEIRGADNLNAPDGILAEFNHNLARFFSNNPKIKTEFLTNGSTSGIHAAIHYAVPNEGDKIIIARNSHRAVYGALILTGAVPCYFTDSVETALCENPDARAVFITSPTYEGVVSDIAEIARITHAHGKILIADEAHGSHFPLSDYFPKNAVSQSADIVINSLHKTLPTDTVDTERMKDIIRILRTSSPSYMLMAQASFALDKLLNEPKIVDDYVENLKSFREKAAGFKNLKLFGGGDKSKIVFLNGGCDIESVFRNRFRIELESAFPSHIIAVTSPADTEDGFSRLYEAARYCDGHMAVPNVEFILPMTETAAVLTPKQAFWAMNEYIPLGESAGRTAADMVIPFPPAVPLAVPGELITRELISAIGHYTEAGINLSGVDNNRIKVVL